jgi:hypothetical protein
LTALYNTDANFSLSCRSVLAIAFVPVAQAAAAFVALSAGANAQLQVNIFFPIFFLF